MKTLKTQIALIGKVLLDEAKNNVDFAERLRVALGAETAFPPRQEHALPALDPLTLAVKGELNEVCLQPLTDEQLKTIISHYMLKPKGRRLKTRGEFIEAILEGAHKRIARGDAFRSERPFVSPSTVQKSAQAASAISAASTSEKLPPSAQTDERVTHPLNLPIHVPQDTGSEEPTTRDIAPRPRPRSEKRRTEPEQPC